LPLLALVLAVTGVVANAPLVVVAWAWSIGPRGRVGAALAATIALASVALDTARRPRPPAVHTQVPQWWGHRFGPWWAAARYGLRLGLGPATILNTWLWWAGVDVRGDLGVRLHPDRGDAGRHGRPA
jgi:hypothetical protein